MGWYVMEDCRNTEGLREIDDRLLMQEGEIPVTWWLRVLQDDLYPYPISNSMDVSGRPAGAVSSEID